MKKIDIKQGLCVRDRWYPDWGNGIIKIVKKTRILINFSIAGDIVFDYPHVQFLEKV